VVHLHVRTTNNAIPVKLYTVLIFQE
jgi:hypothetical protein